MTSGWIVSISVKSASIMNSIVFILSRFVDVEIVSEDRYRCNQVGLFYKLINSVVVIWLRG